MPEFEDLDYLDFNMDIPSCTCHVCQAKQVLNYEYPDERDMLEMSQNYKKRGEI